MLSRMLLARKVLLRSSGKRLIPLMVGLYVLTLRVLNSVGLLLDPILFPRLGRTHVRAPIVIVGNPRTGTTFLQRFLVEQGLGVGQRVWRLLFPSLTVGLFVKPLMPLLRKADPTRFHAAAAHKTSLTSVEVDDVGLMVRYFDGFLPYGFFLSSDVEDHLPAFDPALRDTSDRDYTWLKQAWRRNLVAEDGQRVVAKLFSVGPRLPGFLAAFPDARVLYMLRDPVDVIPSTLSLVTGVLDGLLGFWSWPTDARDRQLERLYQGLVELMRRFCEDWSSGRIDHDRVLVVRFERLMVDFESLMEDILAFVDHEPDEALLQAIRERGEKQRAYVSKHSYDPQRFGLTEERIRQDCAFVYETFPVDGAS